MSAGPVPEGTEAAAAWQDLEPEELARAQGYQLIGLLLIGPPDGERLRVARALAPEPEGAAGEAESIAAAVAALGERARGLDPEAVAEEYQALFVRLDQKELRPYASWYLAGRQYGKALLALREDMARLGIARSGAVGEPEDHIALLCEMMAGLILGAFGEGPAAVASQAAFFRRHLQGWAPRFFADLRSVAPAGGFYAAVGRLGECFLALETEAFGLEG
ncbi:chaperone TorD involved in molybdoenzyme TorA maturation [Tistlia consotensis]|uniref:Chaperone TorD involved in molybdoenzyme TorA maturation n=1 Tax=Tistlia consotensis USBA 355 TaxID=560819 RepID=A0A1Y6CHQ7_9PROT|nr:molecular chaperone TorD family protein [Tistlia consotensis]SMF55609.1 chaperone TorD involved in molybdoenzyme TorA maturation [Tistlia consotensis USBA 355]SNR88818.1 chaperone TorD involved in molybdoenzyme TorA maturation [Tistlia consotensis]